MNRIPLSIPCNNRLIDADLYLPESQAPVPALIMCHGYNGFKTDFAESAEFFRRHGIATVCISFCGGSTRDTSGFPTTEMTLLTESEDLTATVAFVKKLPEIDSDKIYLFGGSQGGLVSAITAEKLADRIKGLLLLYPAFCIVDDWTDRLVMRENIPDSVEFWGYRLGRSYFETLFELKNSTVYGTYSGPVLIMHGDLDDVVLPKYAIRAKSIYPNAKLEIFYGERHGFSPEGTRRMEGMILHFIRNLESAN